MPQNNHQTFYLHNLGCKVNQEEGGAIAALFLALGWQQNQANPAVIIINSCTVTAVADKKVRNLLRRAKKEHPQALIAICGCYAQRDAAELERLQLADVIVGVAERKDLPQLVEQRLAQTGAQPLVKVADISQQRKFSTIGVSHQARARAYLKVEDGCDQFCHYCIIPKVRGPVRSLPIALAVDQAQQLVEAGHGEIVLSGIHIGAYGQDLAAEEGLPQLISALLAIPRLQRLRLGSIEPQQFSEELLDLIASEPRLCAHLHIPLQAGNDKTLAAMGRHYTTAEYAALIERLRQLRPGLAITTDVIVGYPGESESDFAASYQFCAAMEFAAMHIFPYSKRSGTKAATLPNQVANSSKTRRAGQLKELALQLSSKYQRRFIGQKLDLLAEEIVEEAGKRYWRGHSSNYLPLLLPLDQPQLAPELLPVIAKRSLGNNLLVELAK